MVETQINNCDKIMIFLHKKIIEINMSDAIIKVDRIGILTICSVMFMPVLKNKNIYRSNIKDVLRHYEKVSRGDSVVFCS